MSEAAYVRDRLTLPLLGETMQEGQVTGWLKQPGDTFKRGETLLEVETDKTVVEVPALSDGVVETIEADKGTTVPVGGVLATVRVPPEAASQEAGQEADQAKAAGTGQQAPSRAAAPEAPTAAPSREAEDRRVAGGRRRASPLARRLARQFGFDLAAITGTGPRGRIQARDVRSAGEARAAPAGAPAAAAPESVAEPADAPAPARAAAGQARQHADRLGMAYRAEGLSPMRRTIAQRLQESKQTVPHFYLGMDCRLDNLLGLRRELNGRLSQGKLSVNDFLVRAAALALRDVPEANVAFDGDSLLYFESSDVAVAVATDGGLITPVIRGADRLGLQAIARTSGDLAERARAGRLAPDEYQGGTFTISNLGMYGIPDFAAIINPPQAAILAIGAGEKRPVVESGERLGIATVMSCTLSCDHRAIDGAIGARFLTRFRDLVEAPTDMLL